jgi:regulator of nucleoside diphosphate kinase
MTALNEEMTVSNDVRAGELKPAIVLSAEDYKRLSTLAYAFSKRLQNLADELANEIERARVLATGERPSNIVHMNSEVEFRDETTGKVQKVVLVYPEDADISKHKISVLTPIGTALIGLPNGHSITWKTVSGEVRRLKILSVRESRP